MRGHPLPCRRVRTQLFRMMGMNEYGGYRPGTADATVAFCSMLPAACASYLFLICGKNPQPGGNLDRALLPAIMRFLPSGTSVHNMQHWSQVGAGAMCVHA